MRPTHDVADLALPVFGLALLLVPFLPGVPDRWPLVQVLAGPAKWIVWAIVGGQCLWVAAPHAVTLRAWIARRSVVSLTVAVGLATALAASLAASRLTSTVLFPSGDEPHYLVIAQSLWRDGDLKIENNHERGDYLEYFGRELDPHFLRRGVDEEIYSIHPIGMPLVITPVFALGGYPLTVGVLHPDRGHGRRGGLALGRRDHRRPRTGDAGVGGDRVHGAVPHQHVHHLSRGAGGVGDGAGPADRPAPAARSSRLARVGRRADGRVAAVAQHQVRADVGGARRGGTGAAMVAAASRRDACAAAGRRHPDRAALRARTRGVVRVLQRLLGHVFSERSLRADDPDRSGQHALRRPRPALRSGVRTARLCPRLRAGRLRRVDDGAATGADAPGRARGGAALRRA